MLLSAAWVLTLMADDCGESYCINLSFQDCPGNVFLGCDCSVTETSLGGAPYPTNCEDGAAAPSNEACKMEELEDWQVEEGHAPSEIEYDTYSYICTSSGCDFGQQCSEEHSGPTYDWAASCYQDDCEG